MRILPKQIQLLAVIAALCVAGSNVVLNDSVKASGKGFHQALRDGHRPRHRAFDHRTTASWPLPMSRAAAHAYISRC